MFCFISIFYITPYNIYVFHLDILIYWEAIAWMSSVKMVFLKILKKIQKKNTCFGVSY